MGSMLAAFGTFLLFEAHHIYQQLHIPSFSIPILWNSKDKYCYPLFCSHFLSQICPLTFPYCSNSILSLLLIDPIEVYPNLTWITNLLHFRSYHPIIGEFAKKNKTNCSNFVLNRSKKGAFSHISSFESVVSWEDLNFPFLQ